jgi:poly-gamma-glutamate synthesis protein (capsule biosynthesis protein)
MKQKSRSMSNIALILTIVFTFLLAGCQIENTKDQTPISDPPQTSSSTRRPLPQPTVTRSQIPTAIALPSPTPISSPTSIPIVSVFAPQLWSDDASQAITKLSASDSSWRWRLIADENAADIVIEPGQTGIEIARRPIALSVPFATELESLTLTEAEEIVSNGHHLVTVGNWASMPLGHKALRVDGHLPFDAQYALGEPWSVRSDPRVTMAAIRFSNAMKESVARESLVHLVAVGDIMLDRALGYAIQQGDVAFPFALVAPTLSEADITVGNLESALGEKGKPAFKNYTFQAPPEAADSLDMAGFDVLSLANNHALDYGPEALLEGIDLLTGRGIAVVGAGVNNDSANSPHVQEINGLSIAFLGYVNVPVEGTGFDTRSWTASEDQAGLAWATEEQVNADVTAAAEKADLVIVILHSGFEYVSQPSQIQAEVAQSAINAGANLVIGHHSHVLQGISFYNGGVIVYGLGNFAFEIDGDPSTAMLNVWLDESGVRQVEIVPAVIQFGGQPRLAESWEAAEIRRGVYYQTNLLNQQ